MTGALLHVIFHAMIKSGLFLCAGAIIFRTGKRQVSQLKGIGKEMPVTIGCMTLLSLALIGIPPASGFVSKWYLASGAMASGTGVWEWIGPVVLLVSALLTAGYLLPLTVDGFFPGRGFDKGEIQERVGAFREPDWRMVLPIGIFTAGALLFGCFPGGLMNFLGKIASDVLAG